MGGGVARGVTLRDLSLDDRRRLIDHQPVGRDPLQRTLERNEVHPLSRS